MLLIPAGFIGETIKGKTVSCTYNTVDANGAATSQFTNVAVSGDPVLQIRRLSDNLLFSTGLTETFNIATGQHKVVIDTTDSNYTEWTDYAIEAIDAAVNDGTSSRNVSGTTIGTFAVSARPAGRLYEQVIKLDAGYVTSIGASATREFTGYMTVGDADVDSFYVGQTLTFQPTATQAVANSSVGRAILKSTPVGDGNQVTFLMQDDFPSAVVVGDTFAILPEERELDIVTANITVEFGVGQAAGDSYSVDVIVNGNPLGINASSILDAPVNLQVWRWSDDLEIVNASMLVGSNSGLYKHTAGPSLAIQPNDGAIMQANILLDLIPYAFRRTIFNYA